MTPFRLKVFDISAGTLIPLTAQVQRGVANMVGYLNMLEGMSTSSPGTVQSYLRPVQIQDINFLDSNLGSKLIQDVTILKTRTAMATPYELVDWIYFGVVIEGEARERTYVSDSLGGVVLAPTGVLRPYLPSGRRKPNEVVTYRVNDKLHVKKGVGFPPECQLEIDETEKSRQFINDFLREMIFGKYRLKVSEGNTFRVSAYYSGMSLSELGSSLLYDEFLSIYEHIWKSSPLLYPLNVPVLVDCFSLDSPARDQLIESTTRTIEWVRRGAANGNVRDQKSNAYGRMIPKMDSIVEHKPYSQLKSRTNIKPGDFYNQDSPVTMLGSKFSTIDILNRDGKEYFLAKLREVGNRSLSIYPAFRAGDLLEYERALSQFPSGNGVYSSIRSAVAGHCSYMINKFITEATAADIVIGGPSCAFALETIMKHYTSLGAAVSLSRSGFVPSSFSQKESELLQFTVPSRPDDQPKPSTPSKPMKESDKLERDILRVPTRSTPPPQVSVSDQERQEILSKLPNNNRSGTTYTDLTGDSASQNQTIKDTRRDETPKERKEVPETKEPKPKTKSKDTDWSVFN
jgi:hypothetical protein